MAPSRLVLMPTRFFGDAANSIEPGDSQLAPVAGRALRRTLERYPDVEVVDSAEVARAIAALDSAQDGCATRTCAEHVGARLDARWIAGTKLVKISNVAWQFYGELVEVATGKVLKDEDLELKGQASEMAPMGGTVMGQRLATAAGLVLPDSTLAAPAAAGALTAEQVKARIDATPAGTAPDLAGADLSGLDLQGIDFHGARLVQARLVGANLSGANLMAADLTDAVATDARLVRANMDNTTLRRADFRKADLTGASLFATIGEEVDLSGATLDSTRIIGYYRKAKLVGSRLRRSNAGADPGNQSMGVMRATFVGADLTGADLTGINLFKADLSYASLRQADLTGANLGLADLVNTDFSSATVTNATVTQADLEGAIFTGAKGTRSLKGLDQARNRDKAQFDEHME
ncbi:MAG: pentapeptide repeat-containing protein [Gemmatimonadales bacterium]